MLDLQGVRVQSDAAIGQRLARPVFEVTQKRTTPGSRSEPQLMGLTCLGDHLDEGRPAPVAPVPPETLGPLEPPILPPDASPRGGDDLRP